MCGGLLQKTFGIIGMLPKIRYHRVTQKDRCYCFKWCLVLMTNKSKLKEHKNIEEPNFCSKPKKDLHIYFVINKDFSFLISLARPHIYLLTQIFVTTNKFC